MSALRRRLRYLCSPLLAVLAFSVFPSDAEAAEEIVLRSTQKCVRSPTRVRRTEEDALANACLAYREGRYTEAQVQALRHLEQDPAHARAHLMLGLALWKGGRVEEAVRALERAASLAPDDAQAHLALGNVLRDARRHDDAVEAYSRAAGQNPALAAAHFNRGVALREAGRLRDAILAFRAAARLDAGDFEATHGVVRTLADAIRAGEAPLFDTPARVERAHPGPVSIVVCSVDASRLARFRTALEPHVAGLEHELIVVGDAPSLCEGYSRGVAMSRHPLVVLMHDDVQLLSPQPFHALASALGSHDIVGLAGSRLASGPAVLWAGHPHIHGWVSYPSRIGQGYEAWPLSLEAGVIDGMETLDGLLLAMRRETAVGIGFDCKTFDGFHFYDLDFCVRAHAAGLSLAVTTEVTALHDSAGDYGDEWRRYATRFIAKYPALASAPRGQCHAYCAQLDRLENVARFHRELAGLARMT